MLDVQFATMVVAIVFVQVNPYAAVIYVLAVSMHSALTWFDWGVMTVTFITMSLFVRLVKAGR